jgi:ubiquinone/menaquinone biosynthesis C-methylase UbiE
MLGDANELPFASGMLDAVVAHSFLYLLPNRARALDESFRVLHRGGCFASMEPRNGRAEGIPWLRHWREFRYIISVPLWQLYSVYHGRFDVTTFSEVLDRAGFRKTGTEPALDGLGIIGHGEK